MILANKQHTRMAFRRVPPIVLQKNDTPLRTRFFVSYYIPTDLERAHEIDTCLFFNASNPEIDEVFVLCDVTTPLPSSIQPYLSKITKIDYSRRVLIKDMIEIVNKHTTEHMLNIFGNSDIILDSNGVRLVKEHISSSKYAFALTRKNLTVPIDITTSRSDLKGIVHDGTTDVWMICGKCTIPLENLNIHFGTLGCDPLLNSVLQTRYIMLNPYKDIQTYHYHLSKNTNNYHGPGIREVGAVVSYPYYNRTVNFS